MPSRVARRQRLGCSGLGHLLRFEQRFGQNSSLWVATHAPVPTSEGAKDGTVDQMKFGRALHRNRADALSG
jgi:hypothetical protein